MTPKRSIERMPLASDAKLHQRALLITAIFAWVAHNVIIGSVPGLVSNTLAFCVSAVMLLRVYRSPRLATT